MITIIAAIAKNNALGKDNDLIWHLPEDLKRFKKTTTGHSILMGRNTFESIGRPLPNRTSIIITRNENYFKDGCLIANSLEAAIELVKEEAQIFIIGGAQVYTYAMENNIADVLDITLVHHEFEADVFFPEIDLKIWEEVSREDFKADEKNKYNYSFLKFQKKTN
jgi:dihydrofolate reductase